MKKVSRWLLRPPVAVIDPAVRLLTLVGNGEIPHRDVVAFLPSAIQIVANFGSSSFNPNPALDVVPWGSVGNTAISALSDDKSPVIRLALASSLASLSSTALRLSPTPSPNLRPISYTRQYPTNISVPSITRFPVRDALRASTATVVQLLLRTSSSPPLFPHDKSTNGTVDLNASLRPFAVAKKLGTLIRHSDDAAAFAELSYGRGVGATAPFRRDPRVDNDASSISGGDNSSSSSPSGSAVAALSDAPAVLSVVSAISKTLNAESEFLARQRQRTLPTSVIAFLIQAAVEVVVEAAIVVTRDEEAVELLSSLRGSGPHAPDSTPSSPLHGGASGEGSPPSSSRKRDGGGLDVSQSAASPSLVFFSRPSSVTLGQAAAARSVCFGLVRTLTRLGAVVATLTTSPYTFFPPALSVETPDKALWRGVRSTRSFSVGVSNGSQTGGVGDGQSLVAPPSPFGVEDGVALAGAGVSDFLSLSLQRSASSAGGSKGSPAATRDDLGDGRVEGDGHGGRSSFGTLSELQRVLQSVAPTAAVAASVMMRGSLDTSSHQRSAQRPIGAVAALLPLLTRWPTVNPSPPHTSSSSSPPPLLPTSPSLSSGTVGAVSSSSPDSMSLVADAVCDVLRTSAASITTTAPTPLSILSFATMVCAMQLYLELSVGGADAMVPAVTTTATLSSSQDSSSPSSATGALLNSPLASIEVTHRTKLSEAAASGALPVSLAKRLQLLDATRLAYRELVRSRILSVACETVCETVAPILLPPPAPLWAHPYSASLRDLLVYVEGRRLVGARRPADSSDGGEGRASQASTLLEDGSMYRSASTRFVDGDDDDVGDGDGIGGDVEVTMGAVMRDYLTLRRSRAQQAGPANYSARGAPWADATRHQVSAVTTSRDAGGENTVPMETPPHPLAAHDALFATRSARMSDAATSSPVDSVISASSMLSTSPAASPTQVGSSALRTSDSRHPLTFKRSTGIASSVSDKALQRSPSPATSSIPDSLHDGIDREKYKALFGAEGPTYNPIATPDSSLRARGGGGGADAAETPGDAAGKVSSDVDGSGTSSRGKFMQGRWVRRKARGAKVLRVVQRKKALSRQHQPAQQLHVPSVADSIPSATHTAWSSTPSDWGDEGAHSLSLPTASSSSQFSVDECPLINSTHRFLPGTVSSDLRDHPLAIAAAKLQPMSIVRIITSLAVSSEARRYNMRHLLERDSPGAYVVPGQRTPFERMSAPRKGAAKELYGELLQQSQNDTLVAETASIMAAIRLLCPPIATNVCTLLTRLSLETSVLKNRPVVRVWRSILARLVAGTLEGYPAPPSSALVLTSAQAEACQAPLRSHTQPLASAVSRCRVVVSLLAAATPSSDAVAGAHTLAAPGPAALAAYGDLHTLSTATATVGAAVVAYSAPADALDGTGELRGDGRSKTPKPPTDAAPPTITEYVRQSQPERSIASAVGPVVMRTFTFQRAPLPAFSYEGRTFALQMVGGGGNDSVVAAAVAGAVMLLGGSPCLTLSSWVASSGGPYERTESQVARLRNAVNDAVRNFGIATGTRKPTTIATLRSHRAMRSTRAPRPPPPPVPVPVIGADAVVDATVRAKNAFVRPVVDEPLAPSRVVVKMRPPKRR